MKMLRWKSPAKPSHSRPDPTRLRSANQRKRTKNLNKPVFQEQYSLVGKLNIIYQAALVFLMVIGSIEHFEEFSWYNYLFFAAAECALIFKVVLYTLNYSKLKGQLKNMDEDTANAVNA